MKHRLKSSILALADAGVRFVIAGGVASVLHGVERLTMDLDVALDLDRPNVDRFLQVMRKLNLTPRAPVSPDALADPDKIQELVRDKHAVVFTFWDTADPFHQIDVFLTKELSFESLRVDADTVTFQGREVKVVSRRKLIEIKRRVTPPRPKDIQDIAELERGME
jgi:predicted nucleotidyltransferase